MVRYIDGRVLESRVLHGESLDTEPSIDLRAKANNEDLSYRRVFGLV